MTIEYSGGFCEKLEDGVTKASILKTLKQQCVHGGKVFADKLEPLNGKFSIMFLEKVGWRDEPWFVSRIYGTMQRVGVQWTLLALATLDALRPSAKLGVAP